MRTEAPPAGVEAGRDTDMRPDRTRIEMVPAVVMLAVLFIAAVAVTVVSGL